MIYPLTGGSAIKNKGFVYHSDSHFPTDLLASVGRKGLGVSEQKLYR